MEEEEEEDGESERKSVFVDGRHCWMSKKWECYRKCLMKWERGRKGFIDE